MNKLLETYILDELLVVLETNPLFPAFGAPIKSWEITNIRTLDNHYQYTFNIMNQVKKQE
jgi:hypothetical protein